MNFLSIVIPCYNEYESLSALIKILSNLDNRINFVIIENGSTDGSEEYLRKKMKNLPTNIQIHFKKENTGYGAGVLEGLENCPESEYLGWIHGDLQFEYQRLNSVYSELKNIKYEQVEVFYKGIRTERSQTEKIISHSMGLIASVILKKNFYEINAQPTIFSHNLIKEIKDAPSDFSFDTYIYWLALNNGFTLIRKEFRFPPRLYGESKWNLNIASRLEFSKKLIQYFIKLRKKNF